VARSHKIWVVRQYAELLGAFTVKREMHEFASRSNWYDAPGVTVTEVPDGLTKVKELTSYPLVKEG